MYSIDVITPLLPLVNFWRCFGILPVYKINHGYQLRTSTFTRLISLFILFILIFLHYAREIWSYIDGEHILRVDDHLISELIGIFVILRVVILSISNCHFLQTMLKFFIQADEAIGKTPGKQQRGIINVIIGSLIWTTRAISATWLYGAPLRDILLIPVWYTVLVTEQMVNVLSSEISLRYQTINKCLNDIRHNSNENNKRLLTSTSNKTNNTAQNQVEELNAEKLFEPANKLAWIEQNKNEMPLVIEPARIEILREAHSCLADAFQELNSRVGVFILLDLAYLFAALLNTTVTFLQHCIIQSTDPRGEPRACLAHGICAFDALLRMSLISISCGSVTEEAEGTAAAAARLLRRAIDWDALRELQILGAQVKARKVCFWACGLFTVDRPLLFSICGAVTSYLFILSQLK